MKKKLKTRINRKLYLKILKDVRKLTKEMGVKFVLRKCPINYDMYGTGVPNFGIVDGYYTKNKMYVKYFGNACRRHILHAVFHELRHAIQDQEGLFADFYNENHVKALDFIYGKRKSLPKNYKLPLLSVATRAERDCDSFGNLCLKKNGIKPLRLTPYPSSQTFVGRFHFWFALKKPEIYKRLRSK